MKKFPLTVNMVPIPHPFLLKNILQCNLQMEINLVHTGQLKTNMPLLKLEDLSKASYKNVG